jgi:hypothetical protein
MTISGRLHGCELSAHLLRVPHIMGTNCNLKAYPCRTLAAAGLVALSYFARKYEQ